MLRETQSTSSVNQWLPLAVLGVAAAYVGYVLTGQTANRIACGSWANPENIVDPLLFIVTSDPSVFGQAQRCSAEASGTWIAMSLYLVALIVTVSLAVFGWLRYQQSDKAFIKELRRRDGFARGPEIRQAVGPGAARKRTKKVRPTMSRPKAKDGALRLGEAEGVPVWASLEESLALLGPPRSGKGLHLLIGAIVDAPGPVITTSSRADNLAATWQLRAEKGPVALFDPQGLTGLPTTLKWSPITGCDHPRVANQRATSLITASGLGASSSNQEWKAPAVTIMECLLHAAALDNKTVDELMRWGNNPAEAKEAVKILAEHPAAANSWNLVLQGIIESDPKLLQSKWFGVEGAVKGLSVPEVRNVLTPTTFDDTLNIDDFLLNNGTLYVLGTKTGGSSAGPFLIAMMDAITERAREIAAKQPGNRLDPPLSLVLDEIANISGAWPGLTQLMADGGGIGISCFAVFQSLAQARNEWGEQQATALFDAATVKIQLGGASNVQDLDQFSKLAGPRQVVRSSSNSGQGFQSGTFSNQIHDEEVLKVHELRRLPFGWAYLLNRNGRPILMEMVKWPDRKDAKQIKTSIKQYSNGSGEQLFNSSQTYSANAPSLDRTQPDVLPVVQPRYKESSVSNIEVR